MFSLFSKKDYACIGVNPDIDWHHIEDFAAPLELHERIKSKVFSKDAIKKLQDHLNSNGLPYKDLWTEFNWVLNEKGVYKVTKLSVRSMIYGVREEFEGSEGHQDAYSKYIAPAIISSLGTDAELNVSKEIQTTLEQGVIVPLHFKRYQVIISECISKGRTFRNIEIEKKMEDISMAPNDYEKVDSLIDEILDSIDKPNFAEMEQQLLNLLNGNEILEGRYALYNAFYYMGVANIKKGNINKALEHFNTLDGLQAGISPTTKAKDFLRPIGELFEEYGNKAQALKWYKRAIEVFPNVGLKKKIIELEG